MSKPLTATELWEMNKAYWETGIGRELEEKADQAKQEIIDSTTKALQDMMFFVISHGYSLEKPGIVGPKQAKWVKDNGIEVLSHEEYTDRIDK